MWIGPNIIISTIIFFNWIYLVEELLSAEQHNIKVTHPESIVKKKRALQATWTIGTVAFFLKCIYNSFTLYKNDIYMDIYMEMKQMCL